MIIHLDIEFECEGGGMGSDVQWQIDNGYLRQVMGDFSRKPLAVNLQFLGDILKLFKQPHM